MTSTNERAGLWVRVSTGGQDEAQQIPEVEGYCTRHGYTVARRYELNDKSASKGEQQAKLDEMLADIREGHITVVVCWRSNRLERRGPEALFKLLRQVKDAGGRIESTTEPMLGTEDMSGEAMTALGAVMDKQFSAKISEDTLRAITGIKASGHIYNGNVPWGFVITGPKRGKTIEPTDVCREYAPQIFNRCIAGDSLRTIAAWLDSEGVKPTRGTKWNEGSVRWILRNRVYAGRLLDTEGQTILRCEAVVKPEIYDRANESLKNRPKRGPVAKDNRPMLAALKCARCDDSPMYRIKASRGNSTRYFYRCTGRGPQRKGCGNMISLDTLNSMISVRFMLWNDQPFQTRTWVEGENWESEISDVHQDLQEQMKNILADGAIERITAKRAELARYTELNENRELGHWAATDVMNDDGSVRTIGQHFYSLDGDGRRDYLATHDIRAEKTADGRIRVVIDGREDSGPAELREMYRQAVKLGIKLDGVAELIGAARRLA